MQRPPLKKAFFERLKGRKKYQDTQRCHAFWWVLYNKKPPKSIPLGVLVQKKWKTANYYKDAKVNLVLLNECDFLFWALLRYLLGNIFLVFFRVLKQIQVNTTVGLSSFDSLGFSKASHRHPMWRYQRLLFFLRRLREPGQLAFASKKCGCGSSPHQYSRWIPSQA